MRLIRVSRYSTSATKLKFVFCLILVEGALCVQNQGNSTENNTIKKTGPESNGTDSNESASNRPDINVPIRTDTVRNGLERKQSASISPAPVHESFESENHTEFVFENDSVHETINPAHEIDQHPTTVTNQEIHIPETPQEDVGFTPSMHLGQISEINFTGTIMNPFNKVQHVGFENVVSPEANLGTHPQLVRHKLVKFYDTDNGYKPEAVKVQPIQHGEYLHNQQNLYNSVSKENHQIHHVESNYDNRAPVHDKKIIHGILSMRPLTFDEGSHNLMTSERPYYYVNVEKPYHLVNVDKPYPQWNIEKPYPQLNIEKPTPLTNIENPYSLERPYHVVYEKPAKFQDSEKFVQPLYTQSYEYIKPFQFEHIKKPEFELDQFKKPEFDFEKFKKPEFDFEKLKKPGLGLGHFKKPEISVEYLQPGLHGSFENFGKPESMVYFTTHDIVTRTKKFPYQFHHPLFGSEMPLLHEEHPYEYENEKRVSPWKKIIHLLGAVIPIGLLLAALTPRVVTVNDDNTTDPNIVLAKLRSANLPAEHKQGRLVDNRNTCKERPICELILGGAKPKSNLMQNVLWNLSNRITDQDAAKNGLQEIFAAVKRKDCGSLTC